MGGAGFGSQDRCWVQECLRPPPQQAPTFLHHLQGVSSRGHWPLSQISDDDTTIIVDKVGDKGAPYSDFVEEIKKCLEGGKQCRYAAVDVEVQVQRQGTDGSSKLNKVIFVQFCPDDAPVRRRMLYASSVRALKATLGLESLMQIQASDLSDLDEKVIKHELMTHQRT